MVTPGTREEQVTALWADTSLQPEGLEGVCSVQTDAIPLAPTAVGNITGLLPLPRRQQETSAGPEVWHLSHCWSRPAAAWCPLLGQGSLTEERQGFDQNPCAASFSPTHFLSMELPCLCLAAHPTQHCALTAFWIPTIGCKYRPFDRQEN